MLNLGELEDMTLGQDGDRSRYQAIVSFMYTYFSAMYPAPSSHTEPMSRHILRISYRIK